MSSPAVFSTRRRRHSQSRWAYYRRIFAAYLTRQNSQLTFWHEVPEVNDEVRVAEIGQYYMPFLKKADYAGHVDANGIPMLDYRGALGLQYNPIAIAQYGLGNYNMFRRTRDGHRRDKFLSIADWLVNNLEPNDEGFMVWHHRFDWEYRTMLRSPWYSGLAQGQGISLLLRAFVETGNQTYFEAAKAAFEPMLHGVSEGGVAFTDSQGNVWIEEYVVHPDPPTHILNGFMWATWGIYDYGLVTGDETAIELFARCMRTIAANLHDFDAGFWSLYEQSSLPMRMLASPFYHQLHIVQLRILHRLTGNPAFLEFSERWADYQKSWFRSRLALVHKAVFKLFFY